MLRTALLLLALLRRGAAARDRPNVILILADDLGFGDLGWGPFLGQGDSRFISTPHLQRMAAAGVAMTNFHSASPVCSPARASIMLGLFPWRVGVDFIYAGDLKKDGSYELDHEQLPLIPNVASTLRDAGYYTAHIGKWHLGGTAPSDLLGRRASNCTVPGILQYGFDEYVGMTEGCPDGSRCKTHQQFNTYATGAKYLVKNDFTAVTDYWVDDKTRDKVKVLTDKQTDEAMRVVREQAGLGRRFFLNLWFDAPHSPWEAIEPFFSEYRHKGFSSLQMHKYASMVSNMDMNIGRLLDLVDQLGIAESTLIVFTSDNGPENGAGSAGRFKGRKRQLAEGGLRVPAIWQWKGALKPGVNDKFALSTDLFPTILHAARVKVPPHVRLDGVSLLPALLLQAKEQYGDERVVLFYVRTVGFPKLAAAWSNGYKLMWSDYEGRTGKALPPALRLFDMRDDPYEDRNLIPLLEPLCEAYARRAPEPRWADFASANRTALAALSRPDRLSLIGLAQHLHIAAHLFRHQGEKAWHLYHDNKPYEAAPSCRVRSSREPTLDWSGHLLAPEFCGESVFREAGPPLCRCSFRKNNCSDHWKLPRGQGWTQGVLRYGLDALSSPSRGGLQQQLRELLRITGYRPICPKAGLVAPASSSAAADSHAASAEAACHSDGLNEGWAHGDVIDGSTWARSCHQRLRARGKGWYSAGASCGNDRPLLVLNAKGMPHPLPLCPESLLKIAPGQSSAERHLDDNVMMVAVYDAFSALLKSVAIVDPLFLHVAGSRPEPPLAALTGFFDPWESRIAAGVTSHIVLLAYERYAWSVAVLHLHSGARVDMALYSPQGGSSSGGAITSALGRVFNSSAFAGGRLVGAALATTKVVRPCACGGRGSGGCVFQYLLQLAKAQLHGGAAAAAEDPGETVDALHARLKARAKTYLDAEKSYLEQQSRALFNTV